MNKVALISLYFGKFPANFGLWLKSAARNADIDFPILLTDPDAEPAKPLFLLDAMINAVFDERLENQLWDAVLQNGGITFPNHIKFSHITVLEDANIAFTRLYLLPKRDFFARVAEGVFHNIREGFQHGRHFIF